MVKPVERIMLFRRLSRSPLASGTGLLKAKFGTQAGSQTTRKGKNLVDLGRRRLTHRNQP